MTRACFKMISWYSTKEGKPWLAGWKNTFREGFLVTAKSCDLLRGRKPIIFFAGSTRLKVGPCYLQRLKPAILLDFFGTTSLSLVASLPPDKSLKSCPDTDLFLKHALPATALGLHFHPRKRRLFFGSRLLL